MDLGDLGSGREILSGATEELPMKADSITAYNIIGAKYFGPAERSEEAIC